MKILIEKGLAKLLFWVYEFLDAIGEIFNILTGTQKLNGNQTLLEVFMEHSLTVDVLLGLVGISIIIAAACMCVKIVKNIIKIKTDGEPTSHVTALKQGGIAVISSVACIFFVFMFITFSAMLLNMVNDVIAPEGNRTLSQNLFNLSVQQSYVLDEDWAEREVGDYYDESGNRVQATDPTSDDGLAWETDDFGNYILDGDNHKKPIYVKKIERYHPYKTDADGNLIIESGWCDNYTAEDLDWSYSPDKVFGVYNKGLFGDEQEDLGYSRSPMVRLQSFNFLTAYLVAAIMLISIFMLSVGLVKRLYDIVVLFICMPLVCGTIPLDDGARFRAWRETMMSKVLVAFGAVIAINVFYMMSGFIISAKFDALVLGSMSLDSKIYVVFKMIMLLGGAMCINGSQALIARIFGTSADESREAMQSFAMITSGVRLAALGGLGAARVAMGAGRMVFGGTNRYGRQQTGILPMAFRGVNAIATKKGGEKYENSKGARFIRFLGRMGNRPNLGANNNANNKSNVAHSYSSPDSIARVEGTSHKSSAAFKR